MCELLGLSSQQPTRLTFSLATLAAHGAPDGRVHDGWGAAFFEQHDVALFREPRAAGGSELVRYLESEGPACTLAISHIRRATQGAITLANTQPFVRALGGRQHVFAHNGDLHDIGAHLPLATQRPIGDTDSEHAFCILLDRLVSLWTPGAGPPKLAMRLSVVAEFAAALRALGPANFLYCDGEVLFAHGHRRHQAATGRIEPPGLHLWQRDCGHAADAVHGQGVSVAAGVQQVALVASVPLTDEGWRPMAEGEVVAVAGGRVVATQRA